MSLVLVALAFAVLDIALVKLVYFVLTLLILSAYPRLTFLHWWFYLILGCLAAFPLLVHYVSQPGGVLEKARGYANTNLPAYQILLFFSVFFITLVIGRLFPLLTTGPWWLYVSLIVVLAIKPLTKNWFW